MAVYQQMLTVQYVEALLQSLQREFAIVYKPGVYAYPEFTTRYRMVRDRLEKLNMTSKQRQQGRKNGLSAQKVSAQIADPSWLVIQVIW